MYALQQFISLQNNYARASAWLQYRVQLCKNYANRNCMEKSIYNAGRKREREMGWMEMVRAVVVSMRVEG